MFQLTKVICCIASWKIDKFRIAMMFEFGKSATTGGDVSIVRKHFCTGYIEQLGRSLIQTGRVNFQMYFPREPRRLIYLHQNKTINVLCIDEKPDLYVFKRLFC